MSETPLTDAAVIMVDGEQPLLVDDAPVVFASHARALERRNRELERAVEDAPHELYCGAIYTVNDDMTIRIEEGECNCWKSRIGKEG